MAERLARDSRQRTLPTYQQADMGGFMRGVSATNTQIQAKGQEAGAHLQQARVLDQVQDMAFEVGKKAAEHRGRTAPLPKMRDENGHMVPLETEFSLAIDQNIYQEREVKTWGVTAESAYREESNRASEQYRMDGPGYRKHMQQYRQKLLANAPQEIRSDLGLRLDMFGEGVAKGIDTAYFRHQRQVNDRLVAQEIEFDLKDYGIQLARDTPMWRDGEPNPEVVAQQDKLFDRLGAMSDEDASAYNDMASRINTDSYRGIYAKLSIGKANEARDATDLEQALQAYKEAVVEGRVEIYGFPRGYTNGRSKMTFDDLNPREQAEVRDYIDKKNVELMQNQKMKDQISVDRAIGDLATTTIDQIYQTRMALPKAYQDTVRQVAGSMGVPEIYPLAMMVVESNGNPNASSKDGAWGLMQVIPGTWTRMEEYLSNRFGYEVKLDRTNPDHQIQAGIAYIQVLQDMVDKNLPGIGLDEKLALVTAGYYGGEGRLITLMQGKGFNPLDYTTWPGFNEGVAGEKSEQEHVSEVLQVAFGMGGGHRQMANEMRNQLRMQFGQSPLLYQKALSRLLQAAQQAESWQHWNQSLTYTPPGYNTSDAKQYVEAAWGQAPVGTAPQDFYQSIARTMDTQTPHGAMVSRQAFELASREINRGKGSGNALMRQLFMGPGEGNFSREMAERLDPYLPASEFMPQGRVADTRVALKNVTAAVGDGPQAGKILADRYFMSNGQIAMEGISMAQRGIDAVVGGELLPEETIALGTMLNALTGHNPYAPASRPGVSRAMSVMENIAGIKGGPMRHKSPKADFKWALDYFNRNYKDIAAGDGDKQEYLRKIVAGEILPDAYDNLKDAEQQTFLEHFNEKYDDAFTDAISLQLDKFPHLEMLPNKAHVDPMVKDTVLRRAVNLIGLYPDQDSQWAVHRAVEQLVQEGYIGGSSHTFGFGVTRRKNWRPGHSTFTTNPVENALNPSQTIPADAHALLPPEQQAHTLYGMTQAKVGEAFDVIEQYEQGNLLWQVGSMKQTPNGNVAPQLLIWTRNAIPGSQDRWEWGLYDTLDTSSGVDVAWEKGGKNQFTIDAAAATGKAYGFWDVRGDPQLKTWLQMKESRMGFQYPWIQRGYQEGGSINRLLTSVDRAFSEELPDLIKGLFMFDREDDLFRGLWPQ